MKNAEAIEILTHPNEEYHSSDGTVGYTFYPNKKNFEAFQLAIKGLEQEPTIDKIRAEISNYGSIWVRYKIIGHTDQDIKNIVENVLKQAKEQVLDIIDKYKESDKE